MVLLKIIFPLTTNKKNMNKVKASDTLTEVTHIVMPNDANPLQFLRGGRLVDWMDIASEITTQKLTHRIGVTVAIDKVTFNKPIRIGDIVTIRAQATRTFKTSMEVLVEVWAENLIWKNGKRISRRTKTNEAYFTFVAIDEQGKPAEIHTEIVPGTQREKELFISALERRNTMFKAVNPNLSKPAKKQKM